ncbi:MAG: DUF3943 domain-containing protein [Candidatus Accumulibacter sp. UW20]|jgi:hypothetical protein
MTRFSIHLLACTGFLLTAMPAAADNPSPLDAAAAYGAASLHRAMPFAYRAALEDDSHADQEAGAQSTGYAWQGAAPDQPDWRGLRRDTLYFLGYQFVAIAALYVAPASLTNWDREEKKDYSFSKWRENVSSPVWDDDKWGVNYVLHPYWGGAYYIRARERGLDRAQSFWYSALLSTLYEYGAEALFEPVSIQDLLVTPIFGSLLGEYLFSPWRERIRAKPGPLTRSDQFVLLLTDPIGVLNAETDRLLGVRTRVHLQPLAMRTLAPAAVMNLAGNVPGGAYGGKAAWGLQLRIDW